MDGVLTCCFFFLCDGDHRDLHSFPTRRSSDLASLAIANRFQRAGDRRFAGEFFADQRRRPEPVDVLADAEQDRKSTRLNSSHVKNSYAVFCLKKKKALVAHPFHHALEALEAYE